MVNGGVLRLGGDSVPAFVLLICFLLVEAPARSSEAFLFRVWGGVVKELRGPDLATRSRHGLSKAARLLVTP